MAYIAVKGKKIGFITKKFGFKLNFFFKLPKYNIISHLMIS